MKHMLLALQFLTVVPVRTTMQISAADIPKSASFFVLVGVLQGVILIITDHLGSLVFHHDIVTALMLLAYVLTSGGFHLDGLSDAIDAMAVKSSGDPARDREKRLMVMRGSTAGPIGVTAIVFALGIKYLSLKHLADFTPFIYYSTLLLMPAVSKWAMVFALFLGPAARPDGLASSFINGIGKKELFISTLLLSGLLAMPVVFMKSYISSHYYWFAGLVFPAMSLLSIIWVRCARKAFGGLTGDVCGALGEIGDIIFLFGVFGWLRLSI